MNTLIFILGLILHNTSLNIWWQKRILYNQKELYGESETLFTGCIFPNFLLFLEKLFGKYFVF